MTRENRNLIINALSAILFGVVFLFGFNAVMDAQAKNERLTMLQTYFPAADGFEVVKEGQTELTEKVVVKRGAMTIGYYYQGEASVIVTPMDATTPKKLVVQVFVRNDLQVLNVSVVYSEHTPDYVDGYLVPDLALIKNVMIQDYLSVDLVGGASTFSMPIVHGIMAAISRDLTGLEPNPAEGPDPIEEVFGTYGSATVDSTFTPNAIVVKKEIVKNASDVIIGYAYTLTSTKNTGNAVSGNENENWDLTLMVGVGTDGKIIGVYTIESDHTPSFYGRHNVYFTSLEGLDSKTFPVDTVTGASFSRSHINELLDALKGVLA